MVHLLHRLYGVDAPERTTGAAYFYARLDVPRGLSDIGADSTGATGNFAPVLTQEPGQTLRFAPVPFMAVL